MSQYSSTLAPIAVEAVTSLATATSSNVYLRDVRVVKKVGGTIEDTELIGGVVLNQNVVSFRDDMRYSLKEEGRV